MTHTQIWPHTTPTPSSSALLAAPLQPRDTRSCSSPSQPSRPWKQLPFPVPQKALQGPGVAVTGNVSPEPPLLHPLNSPALSDVSLDDEGPSLPPIINIFYSMAHDLTEHTEGLLARPVKKKRRAAPKGGRRRWSDKETHNLLRGVEKHGVGNWQAILRDEELGFDNRTSSSLKDRYRTCRREDPRLPKIRTRSRPIIPLLPPPQSTDTSSRPSSSSNNEASDSSEAHSDKDQAEKLPPKSNRRKRRLFSASDDREILDGLQKHGPAWSTILSHSTLSDRQPTDLRDRVRNRFPDLYKRLEKKKL